MKKIFGKRLKMFKTCSFCDQAPKKDKKELIPLMINVCEECHHDFLAFISEMEKKRRGSRSNK